MKLYQMPISHFCEKVRWALDYKKLKYKTYNLLPGLHIPLIKHLVKWKSNSDAATSVPVLKHRDHIIQGSNFIIDYLESQFPQNALMPKEIHLRKEIRDWETFADNKLGPHVRRCCYHFLLEEPEILIPMLTHKGPWYGRFLMKYMFPQLRIRMRNAMQIDQEGFDSSKAVLDEAVRKLTEHLSTRQYLVGERFTRADIAVVALLAPLFRPKGYGIPWPQQLPKELAQLEKEYQPIMKWADSIYTKHR